jgi:hypothetical protein
MHLLLPAFLGATALVGLPVVLHLLRLQTRKHIPFPSLFFLGKEAVRDANRQRIRRWLTLLLRCLLIVLVVLAFCRPFWLLEHSDTSRAVVVVIDNSYSMQAEGRSAAVEAWLAPQIASLRAPDQLGVVLMHPAPMWLVPLTDNLALGRSALKSLPQSYETSHYRAAIELAAAKLSLSSLEQKQLLVAADQQRIGWAGVRFERPLPSGVKLHPAPPAPEPKRQAAVVALKATRTGDERIALDVTIRGYAPASDERTVTFLAGGEVLGTQRITVAAGASKVVHAEYAVPDFKSALMLHATIDADELPVDDVAYTALAGTDDHRMILTPGAAPTDVDFLRLALTAARTGRPATFQIDPVPGEGVAWPATTVAILRGTAPFVGSAASSLDAFLSAGGSAWIICDGSLAQTAWLATRGAVVAPLRPAAGARLKLRDFQLDHPLFAPFNGHSITPLLAPTFHRGWSLRGDTVEPIARWSDRTIAIAEVPTGGGRLLITGFGETRADSTFPIEAAYVPFVKQAVIWLAQNQMASPLGCRVGDTLALPGAGTWRAVLTPKTVPSTEVNGYVTPTVPGIYAFEQPNLPKRFYAVNVDTLESDLSPWPTPADFARLILKEPEKAGPAPAKVAGKSLLPPADAVIDSELVDERLAWWWLLLAAIVVLFLELALSNRTLP